MRVFPNPVTYSVTSQHLVTLQCHGTNAQYAISVVNVANQYFHRMRYDSSYDNFNKYIIEASTYLTDKLDLPRQKRTPRRYDQVLKIITML